MAIINASANFSATEVKDMESLIEINEQMKTLETLKKDLSDKVKSYMTKVNIDKVEVNGSTISVTESSRTTVPKAYKDQFVAELVSLNKKHLVKYSIEPDIDSIFAEVDAGLLDKALTDKYIKVTPVFTLRCN